MLYEDVLLSCSRTSFSITKNLWHFSVLFHAMSSAETALGRLSTLQFETLPGKEIDEKLVTLIYHLQ
jgi:hypothetical protein